MTGQSPAQVWGPLLYQALAEPIGLVVRTNGGVERARAVLYKARAEIGDPDLAVLQFRISPWPEGDLVICKAGRLTSQGPSAPLLDEII